MSALSGLRIVITRATHQAEELARPLRELGADVLSLPAIEIGPPEDPQLLAQAAAQCDRYDWIIFSSVNAVEAFLAALPEGASYAGKVATVGDATRRACEEHGLPVLLTPDHFVAESLVAAFADIDLHDHRILIPSAAVTRDVIPTELRRMGALVTVVEAYRNRVPEQAAEQVEALLREPYPDWITFASSSAVTNVVSLAGADRINQMHVASIGPVTSAAARRLGVHVSIEAHTHDVSGLVEALQHVSAVA